ncbi:MAG: glycosyltransferase [Flavobacteriales bacterium]|nr:glycosyltransferase [Flavobacteriales bacterium]
MKNICFFNTVSFWGGGEKLHLEYALEFKERGYNVYMVCAPKSPLEMEANAHKIKTHSLKLKNLSFLNPFKYRKVKRFFKNEKIDTVFFTTSQDAKVGGISAHKVDVERVIYLRGLAVPIKKNFINSYLLKRAMTHLIANSQETKRMILGNFNEDTIKNKTGVIYHGIDLGAYDHAAEQQKAAYIKKGNEIVIGTAGRLTEQKGQYHLINATKILVDKGHDLKVLIAGTGPLAKQVKEQIISLGLQDRIELKGFVTEIEGFLKSIDLFVLPSLWEGFGYAIVEAMAASKAVVAFDCSSNPEIISDGETGILIKQTKAQDLADGIEKLISNNTLMNEMGKAGRTRVEAKFQLSVVIDELITFLEL